jgi:hypothetical protein
MGLTFEWDARKAATNLRKHGLASSALDSPRRGSVEPMSKTKQRSAQAELRNEYDSQGVRGKYAARFAEGSNIVVLAPDVARHFVDSASVNRALRSVMKALRLPSVSKRRRKS